MINTDKKLKNHRFFVKQFFFQKNRKAIEFSFTWLFAVIIGVVILVLAIYGVTKMMSTGQTETGTVAAKEIGILLNPLEINFESGKISSISIVTETRIYNKCENNSNFGNQIIQTSQKNFGKFSEPSLEIKFPNKYIFSGDYEEGKRFNVFSKPFDFPFKTADLIYLTSSNKIYCFVSVSGSIEQELKNLNSSNLLLKNCPAEAIKVCFGSGTGCNITVNYNGGYVKKNSDTLYFETDALMYGAIFSEKDVYECQVKRLMMRTQELADIYNKKAAFLEQKNCNSNLDLSTFKALLGNYKTSKDLPGLFIKSNEIKDANDEEICKLW